MITYRRATPEDVRPALDLVERVWIEFNSPDNEPGALETMRSDITQNKDIAEKYASGRATMFVATDEDNIVGVIGADNRGYIRLLFIDGAFHRKGIATELMNRMICELKRRGFNIIKLNRSGLPFYKNFGFLETGIEQNQNGFLTTPLEYTPNEIWDVLDEHGYKTGRYTERGRKMPTGDLFKRTPRLGDNGHTWFEDVWVFDYNEPIESVAYDGSEVCDAMSG